MTDFFRLSGAGNDFLALVEPPEDPSPREIRAWCTRGASLGADGLFAIRRSELGLTMRYFNADGQRAGLCLNGTRCAARLGFHLGWATGSTVIETDCGPIAARQIDRSRIELGVQPLAEPLREVTLSSPDIDGGALIEGFRAMVGVPHLVLVTRDLASAPVAAYGPLLRRHPLFGEAGTNVNWVRLVGRDRIELRTYERGVEAETLACGTGVMAAVATGLLIRRLELPVTAATRGGFELVVDGKLAPGSRTPERWSLTGDARIVARGAITGEAEKLPEPAGW